MNFEQFLDSGLKKTFTAIFTDVPLIFFTGKKYPLLFFSLLLTKLKQEKLLQVQRIDLRQMSVSQVISQFETCFLGTQSTYWLSDISVLDAKSRNQIISYCRMYSGPNRIMLFASDTVFAKFLKKSITIQVPVAIDQKLFLALAHLLIDDASVYKTFALLLFKKYKTISLDTACLVLQYVQVLGSAQRDFMNEWLDALIVPQQSLFLLSQYFFARQSTSFFVQWSKLVDAYSPQFWCVFWSEQLWRAYHYVYLTRQGNISTAREAGFRLPFSFLRKDWRTLPLNNIKKAHERMYEIDFSLKNGGDSGVFDLFYSQFFIE